MLTVLGASPSPFVRKVRLVLHAKGIPYEHKPVGPGSSRPDFRRVSPLGKIPALIDGEVALCDSSVICLYLERTRPEPPLYPAAAADYGRALWLEEYADTALAAVATFGTFGRKIVAPLRGEPVDEAAIRKTIAEEIPPVFDYLEAQVGDREFLAGPAYSIADIAVATHFVNFRHAGFDVDPARWPQLRRWVDRELDRPIVRELAAQDRAVLGLS